MSARAGPNVTEPGFRAWHSTWIRPHWFSLMSLRQSLQCYRVWNLFTTVSVYVNSPPSTCALFVRSLGSCCLRTSEPGEGLGVKYDRSTCRQEGVCGNSLEVCARPLLSSQRDYSVLCAGSYPVGSASSVDARVPGRPKLEFPGAGGFARRPCRSDYGSSANFFTI